jgi:hypothetical protein
MINMAFQAQLNSAANGDKSACFLWVIFSCRCMTNFARTGSHRIMNKDPFANFSMALNAERFLTEAGEC